MPAPWWVAQANQAASGRARLGLRNCRSNSSSAMSSSATGSSVSMNAVRPSVAPNTRPVMN